MTDTSNLQIVFLAYWKYRRKLNILLNKNYIICHIFLINKTTITEIKDSNLI